MLHGLVLILHQLVTLWLKEWLRRGKTVIVIDHAESVFAVTKPPQQHLTGKGSRASAEAAAERSPANLVFAGRAPNG